MTKLAYVGDMTSPLELAEHIVTDGFDHHLPALAELLADARHRGVRAILVDIVADPAAPTVVRERALGRVVVAVTRVEAARRRARPCPRSAPRRTPDIDRRSGDRALQQA